VARCVGWEAVKAVSMPEIDRADGLEEGRLDEREDAPGVGEDVGV
jgi:hypothetical protein